MYLLSVHFAWFMYTFYITNVHIYLLSVHSLWFMYTYLYHKCTHVPTFCTLVGVYAHLLVLEIYLFSVHFVWFMYTYFIINVHMYMFSVHLFVFSLCRCTHVPVGDDQVKHVELASYLANKFNNKYGAFFPKPKPVTGL